MTGRYFYILAKNQKESGIDDSTFRYTAGALSDLLPLRNLPIDRKALSTHKK